VGKSGKAKKGGKCKTGKILFLSVFGPIISPLPLVPQRILSPLPTAEDPFGDNREYPMRYFVCPEALCSGNWMAVWNFQGGLFVQE
jgi:hypothetical protein